MFEELLDAFALRQLSSPCSQAITRPIIGSKAVVFMLGPVGVSTAFTGIV